MRNFVDKVESNKPKSIKCNLEIYQKLRRKDNSEEENLKLPHIWRIRTSTQKSCTLSIIIRSAISVTNLELTDQNL